MKSNTVLFFKIILFFNVNSSFAKQLNLSGKCGEDEDEDVEQKYLNCP